MPNSPVRNFILQEKPTRTGRKTAVSLFSGAGISDLGYAMAGFDFRVHVEADQQRAEIGMKNFPKSKWVTSDIRISQQEIIEAYRSSASRRLDLLVATPPCQGMSTSNPSRGKRQTPKADALEEKNRLILEVIPVAHALKPRVIIAENVRQILTLKVQHQGTQKRVIDILRDALPQYQLFSSVVNVADYGIPQGRKRALLVLVHKKERWLKPMLKIHRQPWPIPTHSESPSGDLQPWISIREWFEDMDYQHLDSASKSKAHGIHPLHCVPTYEGDRYIQISQIPPHSGRNAYENDICPSCKHQPVELGLIICPQCEAPMRNRPYVEKDGEIRLIKGFHSSYRRMYSERPAYTITTNTSHVGSDFKIHPWENRVLSALECADLQTVPRFYDWTRATDKHSVYLVRKLVGEAFPTYFAHLHGMVLNELLSKPMKSTYEDLAVVTPRHTETIAEL